MTYVFVFGGVLLLLGIVVALSLLRGSAGPEPDEEEIRRRSPAERREAALEKLGEVEFDYRTGKVTEEEYRVLRRRWGRIALEAREGSAEEEP